MHRAIVSDGMLWISAGMSQDSAGAGRKGRSFSTALSQTRKTKRRHFAGDRGMGKPQKRAASLCIFSERIQAISDRLHDHRIPLVFLRIFSPENAAAGKSFLHPSDRPPRTNFYKAGIFFARPVKINCAIVGVGKGAALSLFQKNAAAPPYKSPGRRPALDFPTIGRPAARPPFPSRKRQK